MSTSATACCRASHWHSIQHNKSPAPGRGPFARRCCCDILAAAPITCSSISNRPAPEFVFANAGDNAYALVIPDSASTHWLADSVGALTDPLTRAMGWDALWELVRRRSLTPAEFIAIAERVLPAEQDEQILGTQLRHVTRAAEAYLSPTERSAVLPMLESSLRSVESDPARPYEIRKPNLDALIRVTHTPTGLQY